MFNEIELLLLWQSHWCHIASVYYWSCLFQYLRTSWFIVFSTYLYYLVTMLRTSFHHMYSGLAGKEDEGVWDWLGQNRRFSYQRVIHLSPYRYIIYVVWQTTTVRQPIKVSDVVDRAWPFLQWQTSIMSHLIFALILLYRVNLNISCRWEGYKEKTWSIKRKRRVGTERSNLIMLITRSLFIQNSLLRNSESLEICNALNIGLRG